MPSENKNTNLWLGIFALITLACIFLQLNIIHTSWYGFEVKATPGWLNIGGVLLTLGSWLALLILGFFTAAGWYSYTY